MSQIGKPSGGTRGVLGNLMNLISGQQVIVSTARYTRFDKMAHSPQQCTVFLQFGTLTLLIPGFSPRLTLSLITQNVASKLPDHRQNSGNSANLLWAGPAT